MEEIKITIKKNGSLSYKVAGVVGASCYELTKALDAMCNNVVATDTEDMHKVKEDDNDLTSLGE